MVSRLPPAPRHVVTVTFAFVTRRVFIMTVSQTDMRKSDEYYENSICIDSASKYFILKRMNRTTSRRQIETPWLLRRCWDPAKRQQRPKEAGAALPNVIGNGAVRDDFRPSVGLKLVRSSPVPAIQKEKKN